ncbi:MAG: hypothetical protein IIA17_04170 [candidate division Zixibacteria bacterium]|nr:hypothetical protein [candidate division Zixibacteria bacterium]
MIDSSKIIIDAVSDSWDTNTVVLLVSVIVVFIGYFFTYFFNLRLARRAERLAFLTAQLNELYGPLYVITQTTKTLFEALGEKVKEKGMKFINEDAPKSKDDLSEWQIWLEEVLIPLNTRLEDILIQKAHLIRERETPNCLLAFSAHSAGYRVLVRKWKKGDFSESYSLILYPDEITEYAEESYQEIKKEQLEMIHKTFSSKKNQETSKWDDQGKALKKITDDGLKEKGLKKT